MRVNYPHQSNDSRQREQPIIDKLLKNRSLLLLVIFVAFVLFGTSVLNFSGKNRKKEVTTVIVTSGRADILKQTLSSLIQMSNQFINRTIVVYDGNKSQQLASLINTYQAVAKANQRNIEWIVTQTHMGEIAAVDLALQKVESPFVFLSVGSYNYTKDGFIDKALRKIKSNKAISQVMVKNIEGIQSKNIEFLQSTLAGFNFLPSLHRMKYYHQIDGGFANLTKNLSYGLAPGPLQSVISMYYLEKKYRVQVLEQAYAQKIRKNNFVAKPFQYKNQYIYKRFWAMKSAQKDICSIALKIERNLRKQHGFRRQTKKQLSNIFKLQQSQILKNYSQMGLDKHIQINTPFDYLKLHLKKKYSNITYLYPQSLHHDQRKFEQEKLKQNNITILNFTHFKTTQQSQQYIMQEQNEKLTNDRSIQMKLAAKLMNDTNNVKNLEAQYLYYNKQYSLDKIQHQLTLCIFIQGKNFVSRSNINRMLTSINNQNYSKYTVIFSADENQDYSRNKFYDIARAYYPRVINRLKRAILNQDVLGTAGNHFLRMKQFCRGTDIVVTLNGNSSLVGKQAFNIINSVFQNENTWMVFFNPIKKEQQFFVGYEPVEIKTNLRGSGIQTDNSLITFRYDLATKLPIQYVLQFTRDDQTGFLKPQFYQTESNSFHVYSFYQLSSYDRIQNSKAHIYFFSQLNVTDEKCWIEKQMWTKTKSLLKYPLKKLESIDSPIQIDYSLQVPIKSISKVKDRYRQYLNCLSFMQNLQKQSVIEPEANFNDFLNQSLAKMTIANYYINTVQINKFQQMPFCFVVWAGDEKSQLSSVRIIDSVTSSGYKNYTIITVQQIGTDQKKQIKVEKSSKQWAAIYNVSLLSHSYFSYKKVIEKTCTQNSLIMFLNNPLKVGMIFQLNDLHQRENSWMSYSVNQKYVQIHTLYWRIFQMLSVNDFYKSNSPFLEKGDQQLQTLGILQLCPFSSSRLEQSTIYEESVQNYQNQMEGQILFYLRAYKENFELYMRHPYQYLQTLSQDFKVEMDLLESQLKTFHQNKQYLLRPNVNSYLNKVSQLQAYQYEQLPYLPDNHMLSTRQFEYLQKTYEISKYMTGEYKEKQIRFCFTIFGRNNTENYRYIKNLKSVLMQNYSNYHIVFMDDVSDDDTLEQSMEYLRKLDFPKDRVTFVRNKQRTFATYNIINAAFNFCGEDDVQVRLDGDDALIGRNIFGLLNAIYLKNPQYWVAYTSYKSSIFTYGLSSQIQRKQEMVNCQGGRRRFHFIGPLATWRIKLLRAIPLKYHQTQYGMWLNTLYDDALQFPFFELSTIKRIKYIPYFAYNYNTQYGSNDNSDKQKIKDRIALFEYVVTSDSLLPLDDLDDPRTKNPQLAKILKKDWGKIFQIVKYI